MHRVFEYEGFIIGVSLQANAETELIMYVHAKHCGVFVLLPAYSRGLRLGSSKSISNMSSMLFLHVRIKLLLCLRTYS